MTFIESAFVEPPVLDQAQDPWEPLFSETAAQYDRYLRGEYDSNYRDFPEQWEDHYAHVRTAIEFTVLNLLEQTKKRREEMNVACIGLGMKPALRDFDTRLCQTMFAKFSRLAVVDFSRAAIRGATNSLVHDGKVDPSRILQMQYDITSGYSTLLDQYLRPKFDQIRTEDDMVQLSRELDKCDIKDVLDARLGAAVEQQGPRDTVFTEEAPQIPGGLNVENRPFRLSIKGKEVPLDLIVAPMVVAGTAVTTEGDLWDAYENAMSEADTHGEPSEAVRAERKRTRHRLHELIAAFNTVVCTRATQNILRRNPNASLLSITDFNTRYRGGLGEYPRLHLDKVRRDLLDAGIDFTVSEDMAQWFWADARKHGHNVVATHAKKVA